jgi:hypothetical protein
VRVVEIPGIIIFDAVSGERVFLRRHKPSEITPANEDLDLSAGFRK